jgi:hypothetical protein
MAGWRTDRSRTHPDQAGDVESPAFFLPPDFAISVEDARQALPGNGLKELARFLQVPLISP